MKLRSLYFSIFLFISTSASIHGGVISFQADVDRDTIYLSDHIIYTLTIKGVRGDDPILPDIPEFEVMDSSTSIQTSLIKKKTLSSKSIAYTLIPRKAGKFIIPAASWEYGGKIYKTKPIQVTVLDSDAADPSSLRPGPKNPLFIRAEVDKKEAYVNEEITLTIMLLYHGCEPMLSDCSLPRTGDFTAETLGDPECYTRVISGVQYKVVEWMKAVIPSRPGELTIGPVKLKGYILGSRQTRSKTASDSFFTNFFGSKSPREKHPFILNSEPIKLKVKPLPRKERPVNFINTVGTFEFELSAKPTTVKINDPITVTITISGIGNLDSVRLPDIDYGNNLSVYDQDIEVNKKVFEDKIGGEKIFKQIIIPRNIDFKEIPAVTISYFDPSTSSYLMLTSEAIPIKVEPLPDEGKEIK